MFRAKDFNINDYNEENLLFFLGWNYYDTQFCTSIVRSYYYSPIAYALSTV